MAFELPALPSFNVQVPDLTQKALEGAQLRNMMSEMALRKALAPGQVQLQQQQIQASTTQNQLQQMQLQGQQALTDWLKNGDAGEDVPAGNFSSNDKIATFVGVTPTDPIMNVIRSMAKHNVPAPMLVTEAQGMLQRRNEYFKGTKEEQDAQKNERLIWQDALASLHNMPEDQRSAQLAAKLPLLQENSKTDPLLRSYASGLAGHPELIDQAYNTLTAENTALNFREQKAKTTAAEQKVIPAGGAMSPEQQAEAKKQITVETSPAVKQAKVELARATEKARVEAEAGDPSQMGQMMATGMVAPSEIISKFKPELTQKMLAAAEAASQRLYGQPFNAAKAEAQYNYAKNPATQNTLNMITAMTDKGGSIEIAKKAAEKLPKLDEDTVNKVFNAVGREFGSAAATNFHTAMMGVADEYSKVMGGGVSSDTGRQQALDILKANYSSGQLSGAIDTMEQDLHARKAALVRDNPTLNALYPQQAPPTQTPQGAAPPGPAGAGMKWQHRTVNGQVEWRQVKQ